MADSYKDPYQILGVSRDASDEEIKKAYREMVKKYHPDNYANTPMAEIAEEKMKEINDAYDRIKQTRAGASDIPGASGGEFDARAIFDRIRRLINEGNIESADKLLEIFAMTDRNAEWNFLKGCICLRRGYFYDAQKYYETACYMEPNNPEYRAALNNIRSAHARQNERAAGSGQSAADTSIGCCETLLCANCCCNCMGGNMFRCC